MPIIILVNPQMGENIGAVARVMGNFALSELRIVFPRDGWPNEKAVAMAAGAEAILSDAKIYASTREAIADLEIVFATTIRGRDMVKPVVTAREAVSQFTSKTGILFGPERSGLSNDDTALSSAILSIPTNPAFSSLNLAQAVAICCYEWFQLQEKPAADKERQLAEKQEVLAMITHLETALETREFFKVPEMKERMRRNIENIFTRNQLTSQEVQTLRGIIACLEK